MAFDFKIVENKIYLKEGFHFKHLIKSIPGWRYSNKTKLWILPYNEDTVEIANRILPFNIPLPYVKRYTKDSEAGSNEFIIPHLYNHQKESIKLARATDVFADLSEPGTGKTLVQIELMLERSVWPVLVVCPKSIMTAVWQDQLAEFNIPSHILTGSSDKVKKYLSHYKNYEWSKSVFVINYDKVAIIIKELLKIDWKFIILDESTKIKGPQSKRSKAVMKLRDKAHYRSIMTGTLAPNGLEDAFNQFKFVNPFIFGEAFYAFRHRYFNQGGYMNYIWTPKPSAILDFKNKIKGIAVQNIKRDCVDLPPLVNEVRIVEMTPEQTTHYKMMKEEFLVILNNEKVVTAPFVITQMMKLRQIASGFIYNDDEIYPITSPNPKDAEMNSVLEQLGNKRCIIFAHFNSTLNHIAEILHKNCIRFAGSDFQRSKALELFEADNSIKYLVANPASAGHGLNLQFCSNIIYYEQDFSLENYLQSVQRIERIGQKNKMTVYYLQSDKTVDKYIYQKLRKKEDINKDLDINELKEMI